MKIEDYKTDITAEELRAMMSYDPETGNFKWIIRKGPKAEIGSKVGYAASIGYIRVKIKQRPYPAHRLAWLWMTGEWPNKKLDHIDLDKTNNKWSNLRMVSDSQNSHNTPITKRNTSGFKGVSWINKRKKWNAHLMVKRIPINLGCYEDKDEAELAYLMARVYNLGEFAYIGGKTT